MELGKAVAAVFWSEKGQCNVIKVGACGQSFGEVQNIETLEKFTTYGYDTMPKVGIIKINVSLEEVVLD